MAKPTYEELQQELADLKKKNEDVEFKVGDKGGVSAYLGGRFPVTLYVEQWERLLGASEKLKAFLKANSSKLKRR